MKAASCAMLLSAGNACVAFVPSVPSLNSARPALTTVRMSTATPEKAVDKVNIGSVKVSQIGIGTWAWGDKIQWGYDESQDAELQKAFNTLVNRGINFFDTAEAYGPERSETLLGQFRRQSPSKTDDIVIASKFAALPWRIGSGTVVDALKATLERLQQDSMPLYQLHWPGFWQNEEYWKGIADAHHQGLIKEVGLCNYAEADLRKAYKALSDNGVRPVSNQFQYSLIHRDPESDGQLKATQELGMKVIAYCPLGQGLLTGKYSPENPPPGVRGVLLRNALNNVGPVVQALKEVGQSRGKTPAQVAINWLVCKDAVPIPGVRTVQQAEEIAGSIGWNLSKEEISRLNTASREASCSTPQLGPGN